MKRLLIAAALVAATGATGATAQSGPADYAEIARLRDLNRGMQAVRPTPDGKHYTVLQDNAVLRYAYAAPQPAEVLFPAMPDDFRLVDYALSPDGKTVLAAEGATPIYRHSYTTRYHLKDADGIRELPTGLPATRDASFSPDGGRIALSLSLIHI